MEKFVDIYQFTHFRKYLEEYQAARAQQEPGFTRTEICNLLGMEKSRSYFADVLRGKKVSPRMVTKFIEVLGLEKKEARYFETMVQVDQAKNDTIRKAAMEELLRQHPNPQHIINTDAYEYYNHWYHSALFAILDAMDVGDDMAPVQKRIFPKVPLGKLSDSLELLQRLGLARKNEEGFWKPTRESISSGPYNNAELIKQYQLQCFELSKQALITPPKSPTVMSTMTFSISSEAYKDLEAAVQEFKAKARRIIGEDKAKADSVYQLNLHLFSNLDPEGK
ncbi:TIGR02147 family protein [Fibrobacter sp. UWH9]|uniref:TIGR02147 family protein n=1 Tax=unclassified Fibrobacter TaxID=2634177 RepID=UPI0009123C89|nr:MULTISPECIES: TIGR02147 family protein [unclassified Fibrobacter]OWV03019.1 TIGR02147 family protein [Fibrobacter sp. UWH3]SHH81099.1 TIGR02147 family protein [Fibrobacter sp. UWH9]SHL15494.1 TIGR02147 family protein [Fibrobacter sp. UWH5]SHL42183.1 TIGR02147 family protein [Fibrobacter sp. UWH6]